MRRTTSLVAFLTLVAAACGGSGSLDVGDVEDGSLPGATLPSASLPGGTLPTGTAPAGTITLPGEDGTDITVITGGGSGTARVGGDSYDFPVEQCVLLEDSILVGGETDEVAVGLISGVGLTVVVDPNGADAVTYLVTLPETEISGNSLTTGGEAAGVGAGGFTDPEQVSVSVTC